MSIESAVATIEHAIRVQRSIAKKLLRKDIGMESESDLLAAMARALEHELRNLNEPPDDTPQGIYLDELLQNLNTPYHWVTPSLQRWIVHRLREGRTIVHHMLEELEIFGAKLRTIAAAQKWIKNVDEGPDVSSETPPAGGGEGSGA